MDFSFDQPRRRPRRARVAFWIILALVVVFVALPGIATFTTDWLWFRELGRTDVYWTLEWGRWLLGLGVGLAFFALVFANILLALRRTTEDMWADLHRRLHARAVELLERTLRRVAVWGSAAVTLFFAIIVGRSAAVYWPKFLLFVHAQRVGTADPIFHRDIGFYFFRLPIWEVVSSLLFTTFIFAFVLTGIVYLATRAIRTVRGTPVFSPMVQAHLSILLALVLVLKAVQYYLGRFTALSAVTGDFTGPNYMDIHARIPGLAIMAVLALLAAGVVLVNIKRRNIVLPIGSLVGLLVASILVLGIYPALLQRFQVDPNELSLEAPYIQKHIAATRQAYGLHNVRVEAFSPKGRVDSAALADYPATVNNVRLWDHRPLLQVYSQRQDLRTYYNIANIDVDRYMVDGALRQVMVAARELDVDHINGQKTWVNQHLIYTHGYGVVMSPVNEVDPDKGEPTFFISDIPPKSTSGGPSVTRPEIYFGELPSEYIIVRSSKQQEFDYPSGDDNKFVTYRGTAGIPLRNPLVRALAAIRFGAVNLLISDYITPESRLVFRRQITERVQTLAPFLQFDQDPYIVVGQDGKLYWMLDAYTGSTNYPYARHANLQTASGDVEVNYVRNPVKVVIDAYSGATNFYLADANEPFIRAWQAVFPGMFKPLSAMPAGLAQHVRVPEGYFNTISEIYRRYHMVEASTFYQQEDLWDIPQTSNGLSLASSTDNMEAYYIAMSLPGHAAPEYLLIRPYTPRDKKNMIAWLSARNDPKGFGELIVYNFPKQSLVFGPEQVQARINQDTDISSAVSLWNQSGSQVLWGNLLVIPVGDSVLYVQPVYLQAERSQIPELQRVIVADQQHVVMRRTLDEALSVLTGGAVAPAQTSPAVTQLAPSPPVSSVDRDRARSALEHYRRAQEARKSGDWAAYGKEMDGVRRDLESLNKE